MTSMMSSIVDGLRRAGLVLVIGALAGLAVHASGEGGLQFDTWSPVAIGNSILIGILYVALLDATVRITNLLLDAFVPLQSDRDIALHAVAPAAGVLLMFTGLTATLKAVLGNTFAPSWILLEGVGAIAALAVATGSAFLALREYYRRDRKDHAEGWEARMRRLRTQTCPPVLFETLDTVDELMEDTPEDAKPLLDCLHALLHYRQAADTDGLVPLADEIEAALWYVDLVQVKHGEGLDVGFDVPDSLLSVPVPRLSLLPLLENAVEHGAARSDEPCTVTITGRHDDAQLCLAVLDTGPGFDTTDPNTILRRGSGISDLYARLRDHFGPETDLSLLPQGVLWCAPITKERAAGPSTEENMPVSSAKQ